MLIIESSHGWLMDRGVWKRLAKMLAGTEWMRVEFTFSHKSEIPECNGVYIMCATPPECSKLLNQVELCNVMYVGKSKNLRNRFVEHLRRPADGVLRLRREYKRELSFWYSRVSPAQIDSLEGALIKCFRPAANRQLVRGRFTSTPISAISRRIQ